MNATLHRRKRQFTNAKLVKCKKLIFGNVLHLFYDIINMNKKTSIKIYFNRKVISNIL